MNNPHAFHFTIALAGLLLLAGCSTRRPYRAPALPQIAKAESWNTGLAGGASTRPADEETLSRWWATLGDSVLTSLEERAVKGNLDLRKAEGRIRQARAQWEVARAERNVGGSVSTSATGNRSNTRSGGGYAQTYYGTLQASWEPDFFHRIEKTAAAYGIDVETAREDLRATLVSLTAQVALDYIDVRSYQQQLAITKDNLAREEQTYKLTVAKYESGLATRLDVEQAATNVESTRAGIPSLETAIQKSCNAIAVLLGEKPGAVDAELAVVRAVPTIPAEVAVGIPADLMRRRPDIRSAERHVAAQSARVGAAAAELYPSFSLSATFALTSFNVLNYLTPASLAASLAGSVQQTVFNRRKLRENVKVQDAALDQYVTAYEDAVLSALRDVEDALKAFAGEQVRRKSLADAAASAERAAEMSRNLYGSGLKDFLSVLDAERSVLTLQNEVAQSDAAITANLVRLYKALGGGWS